MVKVYTKDGSAFHEPPYTEQEHLDLQRWMNGGVVRFSSLQHPRQPKKPEKVRPEMKVHNLYRAELGHQRMPQYYSGRTIPKCDIKPDTMNDPIAARLERLQACGSWSSEKAYHRESLERLCEAHGYLGFWVDPRDYLVHRVGQSFLYDVPIDKRGNLAPFAGKRVRVACLHSGAFRRHVRIGTVGECE